MTEKFCGWCTSYKPADTGKKVMTAKNKYKKFKCGKCVQAHKAAKKVN